MAEARNATDIFYAKKSGFDVYGRKDEEEDGYYHLKLTLPRVSTVAASVAASLVSAKRRLWNRIWPARPTTVAIVVGGVTIATVTSSSESKLRSGILADVLWKADIWVNWLIMNPLHKYMPVDLRVGYLAALTAFGGMLLIVSTERAMLRGLLSWKGWLYSKPGQATPTSVKIWGGMVTLLSGPRNLMYSFQSSLPYQPVPSLSGTCQRYLSTIKPLLNDAEYEKAAQLAKEFQRNEGPKLQRYLWLKHFTSTNYIADWWEKYVYLSGRTPLMINSNYYVMDSDYTPMNDQIKRAANIVHFMLVFKDMVENETLKPLLIRGLVPLCMEQYRRMFSTTRVPGRECDQLKHKRRSAHIVVMRRGHFYKLRVYHGKGSSMRPCTPAEIEEQLRFIDMLPILDDDVSSPKMAKISKSQSTLGLGLYASRRRKTLSNLDKLPAVTIPSIESYEDLQTQETLRASQHSLGKRPSISETDIAAFTAGPRTRWANVRERYFSEGANKVSLKTIETAAFVLNLEGVAPGSSNDKARSLFHGDGASRWFDKSLTVVVYEDGQAGLNAEHSWADAPVVAHMWEFTLLKELMLYQGIEKVGSKSESKLPAPVRLSWSISRELAVAVKHAKLFAQQLIGDVQLQLVKHDAYGKGFMKKCGVSPDAYIQMALQIAYFRARGELALTYESSMTRLFRLGRTETVRALTTDLARFVESMHDPAVSKAKRIEYLRAAGERHQSLYRNAMAGRGVDRHLFALYVVSKGLGTSSAFLNDALSKPWRLSTSQQPQQQTMLRRQLSPEIAKTFVSPGGGFGPVADDGYGVSYMIIGEDMVCFHVSSKRSSPETDSELFAASLREALSDMKALFTEDDAGATQ